MSKTYRVTLPISITIKEGVNHHRAICEHDMDEMDEEQLYSLAKSIIHNTLLKGTSQYFKEFIVSPRFSDRLLKEGKIKVEEIEASN